MTLEELRAKIPGFKCKPGCAYCCSCHCLMSEMELLRIKARYPDIKLPPPDFVCGNIMLWDSCMFLTIGPEEQNKTGLVPVVRPVDFPYTHCAIHEERPIRCRTYGGTVDKSSIYCCQLGCHPEKPLTNLEVQELIWEYEKMIEGQPQYLTFGLIDGEMRPVTEK